MNTDETKNTPLFSIVIPTWNNLAFLKLCLKSIALNSTFEHQILVHVNDGSDGTLEWIKKENIEYTHSEQNIGICWSLNLLRTKVKTDYIVYMNDDMYVCPEWDKVLWDEVSKVPDKRFFFSSTLIQPFPCGNKGVIAPVNLGEDTETFQEEELLKKFKTFPHHDWFGATPPPNIVHRDIWDLVGGYSVEYSPGMYSDPDFSAKLWMAGVRLFKGVSNSRVYHFEARSTTRVKKNKGHIQFLLKWGITSGSFRKDMMKKGENFDEKLLSKIYYKKLRRDIFRSKLKKIFYLFQNNLAKKLWE